MRKELVLILIVVFGGALVVYNWAGAPLMLHSTRGPVSIQADATPAPEEKSEPAKAKGSRRKVEGAGKPTAMPAVKPETEQAAVAAEVNPAPSHAMCCAKTEPPFPTPEVLKMGTTRAEIRSTFGVPNFEVAGTREGRVIDRYYYVTGDRSRLTELTLENGLLTSAIARSGAYFQLPGVKGAERTARSVSAQ